MTRSSNQQLTNRASDGAFRVKRIVFGGLRLRRAANSPIGASLSRNSVRSCNIHSQYI